VSDDYVIPEDDERVSLSMKIAYLDCSSGISGDMFVGALVDAGVPLTYLERELSKIPLKGYSLKKKSVKRCGIKAIKVDVDLNKRQERARPWSDVQNIIKRSKLDEDIRERGLELFRKLFEVEAKVHGRRAETTHLHELGAVDCIVDIFSVLSGLKYLGIKKIYSSSVNVGSGSVHTEHGILPVPAPATLSLLKHADIYATDARHELTTPTGALLVSSLADGFGEMPRMKIAGYGYGAGSLNLKYMPNIMRIIIGERGSAAQYEEVVVVETNIDDMNPQFYDHIMTRLFDAGALDVYMTNVMMKKQRPGIKLSTLVHEKLLEKVMDIILTETTTIGIRFTRWGRITLKRFSETIKTEYGNVKFKKVYNDDDIIKVYPEYDDCRKIAHRKSIPLYVVYETLRKYTQGKRKKQ
jgi:uncharacterized protein (TIGR00299 family) protein